MKRPKLAGLAAPILSVFLLAGCQSPVKNAETPPARTASSVIGQSLRCPSSSAQCEAAFEQGESAPGVSPEDRFANRLRLLEIPSREARVDPEKAVRHWTTEPVRSAMLQLQGLARLYAMGVSSSKEAKRFEEFREEIKAFEGATGDYMRRVELARRLRESGAPPPYIEKAELAVQAQEKILVEALFSSGWLPRPHKKLKQLARDVSELEFRKSKKDKKALATGLLEFVEHARRNLKDLDRHFRKKKYTEEDLEEGVHYMRRALRWITTSIQSADGVFAYSDAEISPSWRERLAPYEQSKYVKLAEADKPLVLLDRTTILLISKLTTDLGTLKDFKEGQLDLAKILLETGLAATAPEAEARAFETMRMSFGDLNVEASAQELYALYLDRDPLKALRKSLEKALE